MSKNRELAAGTEPGLRFACVLDGKGGCVALDWAGVAGWRPEDGVLWVHLERDTPEAERWLRAQAGVETIVADALLAEESRPVVEPFEGALLLVLRGVDMAEKQAVDLVPMHAWIDASRVITLRDREHALSALRDIRMSLQDGRGPRRSGGLLVQICEKIVRDVGPGIEQIDEAVERLEDRVVERAQRGLRRDLAAVRRQAVHLRRYLGPQRDALIRLQGEDGTVLDRGEQLRLRCVVDSVLRYLEDLEALRDRTTILHEELASQLAEETARTSNRLTAVAALLLPPSLVAGILGVNIGGIPGQDSALAFWELVGFISVLLIVQAVILRRLGWL